jgi:hypothetical protein
MGQIFQKPELESESNSEGITPNNYLENVENNTSSNTSSNTNNNSPPVPIYNPYNRIVSDPIDIPVPPINKNKIQTFRRNPQTRTI